MISVSNAVEIVPMDNVRVLKAFQVRIHGTSNEHVDRLKAVLENGGELPPVLIYDVPEHGLILVDGYHRFEAFRQLAHREIEAIVKDGPYEEALDAAEEANLLHGQMLSTYDKKNLLFRRIARKHDWVRLSNREIARRIGVNQKTIGNWLIEYDEKRRIFFQAIDSGRLDPRQPEKIAQKKELDITVVETWLRERYSTEELSSVDRTVTVGADGKARNTTNIGKRPDPKFRVGDKVTLNGIISVMGRLG
jgi:transposase-like protein